MCERERETLLFAWEVLVISALSLCAALITTSHPGPAHRSPWRSVPEGFLLSMTVRIPSSTHTHTHTDSGTFKVFGTLTHKHTVTHSSTYGLAYICANGDGNALSLFLSLVHTHTHTQSVGLGQAGFGSGYRLGLWRDL